MDMIPLARLWQRLPQSLRYLLIGGINTAVGYTLFAVTYWGLHDHTPHAVILAVSHVLAVTFSFTTHQRWVFTDTQHPSWRVWLHTWWRFQLAYIGLLILGLGVNAILLQWVTPSIWWAQAGATLVGIVAGYVLQRRFVFKRHPHPESHCA
jgi:putative flippase GtrA